MILVLEFEMLRCFDTKQKIKSFTVRNCVWLHWLCVIVWFTLNLNFWYLNLKLPPLFFWGWRLIFLILCYHAKHLQQIHCSKLCAEYMVWLPNRHWQDWTFVKYWWDAILPVLPVLLVFFYDGSPSCYHENARVDSS